MKLASVFTNGLVLQRDLRAPVWGVGRPGAIVTVEFAGRRARAVAEEDGRWTAWLPPLEANATPGAMRVSSTCGESCVVEDVLVGEVWLCSGQSNMEHPLSAAEDAVAEVAQARYPAIRLLHVPRRGAAEPAREAAELQWRACSPETGSTFSAVGYYFGRELHRRLQVPVGLINASWGGTCAETWTSREGLADHPTLKNIVEEFERSLPELEARRAEVARELEAFLARTRDAGNTKHARGWAGPDEPEDGAWADMELPGYWQRRGCLFSGVLWFRRAVELPPAWAGQELRLSIGATDKSDTTYFNNLKVGGVRMEDRDDAWCMLRTYAVPGHAAKKGRNIIAVRVHSGCYSGGMTGPVDEMRLSCPACPSDPPIPLAGVWRYAVEANYGSAQIPVPTPAPGECNAPHALFNGMIAPLAPYALRGAIWYQGENNVARAGAYRDLLPALIRDWRRVWGQGDFPFHFVQLANFVPGTPGTPGNEWADLREAQRLALRLPNTGMAVTIDIGDPGDIHPRNKRDVGLRLAFNALHATYGLRERAPCGPLFRHARREGHALRLSFDAVDGGLVARESALDGFTAAGADRVFERAAARIEGEHVMVACPAVPAPKYVRYAWADNPTATLYNAAGLPASPFEGEAAG